MFICFLNIFKHDYTLYMYISSGGIHVRIPGIHLDNVEDPYVQVVPWKTSDDTVGAKLPCTIVKGPEGRQYLEFITLPYQLEEGKIVYCE